MHEVSFVTDLAYILITAGFVSLIFKRFHQPVVVGYLVAGFLIGPNAQSFYNVSIDNIQLWADIGIVFLLFSLGLDFSFKKLLKTGLSSGMAASVEIPILFFIGYAFAGFMDWPPMTRIFLGAMLCISSTAIIYRTFDELNLRAKSFTQFVFGVLIFEDIVAILLLVLLPAFALTKGFSGVEFSFQLVKMFAFVTLWFMAGIFLLPTLFRKIKKLADDELYVLLSLGLCFAMVAISVYIGFSAALGAFVMGSLLAETGEKKRITTVFAPIRNLFAAIFFVSIGMLISPVVIKEHVLVILALSLLVLFGKTFGLFLGSILAGQSIANATLSASSMAQIGEFSFILAKLGVSKDLIRAEIFPIIVGVSIITTFITPYWLRYGIHLSENTKTWVPKNFELLLNKYDSVIHYISFRHDWMRDLQRLFLQTIIFSVLIFFAFFATKYIKDVSQLSNLAALLIALSISAPFIWAMLFKKINLQEQINKFIFAIRFTFTFIFVLSLSTVFFLPLEGYLLGLFSLGIFGMWYFSTTLSKYYSWYENHFLKNYSSKVQKTSAILAPWDIHISTFSVNPFAKLIGFSIGDLKIREKYGITVASIFRGDTNIFAPAPSERIYPYDRLSLIGGDAEISHFKAELLDSTPPVSENSGQSLIKETVSDDLNDIIIKESKIRQRYNGIIVGIERQDKRILNPNPNFKLKSGDLMWLLIQTRS